ncbi:alpha/beta fold hydrolase [Chitinophaga niabensis]|uniref:Pimeloyl-ACP methyl ester carboxylesterase n=1 Tax=Chitinophaga niabensis TaxID=536979 RepID=A0A1N6DS16_9BACT|nr:alpha/beta fold hydrolase [Chitinophaga niabensis]SIN73579.1 Pimeloyl-ACP methyl ester carboxylesterase [Chitinophaga niabensis]
MKLSVSVKGNGRKALIFLHQACGSRRTWDKQVNDPLFEQYTRICADFPGHGASGPAEAYSLPVLGQALADTLQELDLDSYIIVSLSMAGNIAAEALPRLRGCKGLFIAGGCLLGGEVTPLTVMHPFEHGAALFEAEPSEERLQGYVSGLVAVPATEVLETLIADYRNTDPAFRAGLAASLGRGEWSNQILHVEESGIPVAFVYGEQERIINNNYLNSVLPGKWRGTAHTLPSAGHLVSLDQPAEFNRLLAVFANEIFSKE